MSRAFTLIEMLVTLAIIAMVASLSYPAWQSFFSRQQDKLLQRQVLGAIDHAQSKARVLETETMLVLFENRLVIRDHHGQLLRQKILSLHGGLLKLRSYPWYRHDIRFAPNQLMIADDASFIFCKRNADHPAWIISLSQTGYARVVLPDREGLIHDSRGREVGC